MKVLILGNIASGKTTLAKLLGERYSVPVFEIDQIVHDDKNHVKRTSEEQIEMTNEIIRKNRDWILEGMPRHLLELISGSATSIIYLDYDMKVIERRLRNRYLLQRFSIKKEDYKVDSKFYKDMKNYQESYDSEHMKEYLKKYSRKIIILKNKKDYRMFLKAVEKGMDL